MSSASIETQAPNAAPPFTILALFRFLIGDRTAIQTAAAAQPGSAIAALLLVLSAGFAREYDGEYLYAEPWYLFVPLLAATGMGTVLWFTLKATFASPPGGSPGLIGFLTCYGLTAPLAWVYAIPVERFCNEASSVGFNLWLLTLVSVWRVLLITRVAAVLFGRPAWMAILPVLLFASTAVLFAVSAELRVPEVMSGLRVRDAERLLVRYQSQWLVMSLWAWPVSLVGVVVVAYRTRCVTPPPSVQQPLPPARVSPSLFAFAVTALVAWLPLLPGPQREQQRRYQVEQDFGNGRIDQAMQRLATTDRNLLPPHWRPPPLGYRSFPSGTFEDAFVRLHRLPPDHWCRVAYLEHFESLLDDAMPPEAMLNPGRLLQEREHWMYLPEVGRIANASRNRLAWPAKQDDLAGEFARLLLICADQNAADSATGWPGSAEPARPP